MFTIQLYDNGSGNQIGSTHATVNSARTEAKEIISSIANEKTSIGVFTYTSQARIELCDVNGDTLETFYAKDFRNEE